VGKFLLVVIIVAALIYLLVRVVQTRGRPFGGTPSSRGPLPPAPHHPLGPDDDPEFLRDLNRRQRHRKRDDHPDG